MMASCVCWLEPACLSPCLLLGQYSQSVAAGMGEPGDVLGHRFGAPVCFTLGQFCLTQWFEVILLWHRQSCVME